MFNIFTTPPLLNLIISLISSVDVVPRKRYLWQTDYAEYYDAKTIIDCHEQSFENIDNDKIVGAYAVAIMGNGEKIVGQMWMLRSATRNGYLLPACDNMAALHIPYVFHDL